MKTTIEKLTTVAKSLTWVDLVLWAVPVLMVVIFKSLEL